MTCSARAPSRLRRSSCATSSRSTAGDHAICASASRSAGSPRDCDRAGAGRHVRVQLDWPTSPPTAVPPDAHRRPRHGRADRLSALLHAERVRARSSQDQWTINSRVSLSLGLRYDYFGTVTERDGPPVVDHPRAGRHLRRSRSPRAAIGHVDRLYDPRDAELLAARRAWPSIPRGNGPDDDSHRLQHGLPAAPRPVDLGRARAAARRASRA